MRKYSGSNFSLAGTVKSLEGDVGDVSSRLLSLSPGYCAGGVRTLGRWLYCQVLLLILRLWPLNFFFVLPPPYYTPSLTFCGR